MLASLGAPEVLDRGQLLVERAQAARRLRRRPLRLPGGGQRAGVAQPLAGVAAQGVDVELLGPPVRLRVSAVVARVPAGAAEEVPVRGPVAGAGEPARVDEALGDQQGMAVLGLPVRAEPPRHPGQRPGAEMREDPGRAQDDEPGVVGDQMQAAVAQLPRPADPPVPVSALERARLPAGEREPPLAPLDDVAQPPAGEPPEAEVVVEVDLFVPPSALVGTRQADGHITEGEAVRRGREKPGGPRLSCLQHGAFGGKKPAPAGSPGEQGRLIPSSSSVGWPWHRGVPSGHSHPARVAVRFPLGADRARRRLLPLPARHGQGPARQPAVDPGGVGTTLMHVKACCHPKASEALPQTEEACRSRHLLTVQADSRRCRQPRCEAAFIVRGMARCRRWSVWRRPATRRVFGVSGAAPAVAKRGRRRARTAGRGGAGSRAAAASAACSRRVAGRRTRWAPRAPAAGPAPSARGRS